MRAATSVTMLGLASYVVVARQFDASPTYELVPRQTDLNPMTNTSEWCATVNFDDMNTVTMIWNDWDVGGAMDITLSHILSPPNANWLNQEYAIAYPEEGDSQLNGCGCKLCA